MTTTAKPQITFERSYDAKHRFWSLLLAGEEVATAHAVQHVWSVKVGAKLLGIAPNEEIVQKTFDKVEAQFRKTLGA